MPYTPEDFDNVKISREDVSHFLTRIDTIYKELVKYTDRLVAGGVPMNSDDKDAIMASLRKAGDELNMANSKIQGTIAGSFQRARPVPPRPRENAGVERSSFETLCEWATTPRRK